MNVDNEKKKLQLNCIAWKKLKYTSSKVSVFLVFFLMNSEYFTLKAEQPVKFGVIF